MVNISKICMYVHTQPTPLFLEGTFCLFRVFIVFQILVCSCCLVHLLNASCSNRECSLEFKVLCMHLLTEFNKASMLHEYNGVRCVCVRVDLEA